MKNKIRMYVDGGNRLTKIMEEAKKPFSFPTILSEPGEELDYGTSFDLFELQPSKVEIDFNNLLVEVIKDGESLGKKLVGKAAENRGVLIRDRNRYARKSNDEVILFCLLTGIASNLLKYDKNQQAIDITINQPLVEYVATQKNSSNLYGDKLKGNVRVLYYNIHNTTEVLQEIAYDIESVVLCPEGIATFFHYAVNENGTVKEDSTQDKKTIVFDVGSGQINIAAFDGLKTVGVNTFEKGMLDCYEKISMMLYNNYREKLDRKPYTYDIDNMIRYNNKVLRVKKGEGINTTDIVENVFDSFAYELSKDFREFVKNKFIGNCDIAIFCGGGSEILFPYLDHYLGSDFVCVKNDTSEYHNVIGSMYYRIYKDAASNL
ncbi:plasmid segregation protein ParM [Natronincola peptidivorans]|uniref:Plasmid segregation protein ParM n=1 Tax=Natronincola peptidivorans TaxID=426128 RepID=A0A1I0GQD7_9FIRM|nr:ParM/StbA family protein [Natronincola peptidivorans]SET73530.1 plasmid segregation protein ParM [Natronincola peptidivorans]